LVYPSNLSMVDTFAAGAQLKWL